MDIEELNKTQIILLVLLVTFVTSIATGIVTVALLAQAPPAVTQTVNHIIQRTVEAVTPSDSNPTTVKETTVVVKEDDVITSAISTSFAKLGAVKQTTSSTSPTIALGVLISGGLLLTDSSVVDEGDHLVVFDATSTIFATKRRIPEVGIMVLSSKGGQSSATFRIVDAEATKLGQTVIALPSASGTRVGIGSVTARYTIAKVGETDAVAVRAFDTSISGKIMPGSPLITVSGDLVGLATGVSQASDASTFIALSDSAPLFLGVRGTSTPVTLVPDTTQVH